MRPVKLSRNPRNYQQTRGESSMKKTDMDVGVADEINALKAQVFDLIKEAEMLGFRHKQIQEEVSKLNLKIEELEQKQSK